jgi:hypothetical protein
MTLNRVIISGGGTGGHIFPAIAIAEALQAQNPGIDILFVGANGKMEMEKVPQAGFSIKGLNIAGFNRKNLLKNATLPFKIMTSMSSAFSIVRSFHPQLVIAINDPQYEYTGSIADKKKQAIKDLIDLGFKHLTFFDDSEENLRLAKEAEGYKDASIKLVKVD